MLKIEHKGVGNIFYATPQSAGFDICANEALTIPARGSAAVSTGLRLSEVVHPEGTFLGPQGEFKFLPELQIRPRSGLAAKSGIGLLNSPGTVDADYRGEIKVILFNHSDVDFAIQPGDRIAQGICALVIQIPGIPVKTEKRNEGGFGSTGKN